MLGGGRSASVGSDGGPLDSIRAAAAAVSPDRFDAAVSLWRAACRGSSNVAAVDAAAPRLGVFRMMLDHNEAELERGGGVGLQPP